MRLRSVNPWHITIICSFLISIFVFWTFFYASSSSDLETARSLRYDTVWSSTNGRNEFYKFSANLSQALLTEEAADFEAAKLRFEIFLGRLEIWNSGTFKTYLLSDPAMMSEFELLVADAARLEQYLVEPSRAEAPQVEALLDQLAPRVELIANHSYQTSIERMSTERSAISQRLLTEKRIVLGLLVLSTCLLTLVMVQNWRLIRANRKIAGDAKQLEFLAKHDGLTSLPNRARLSEFLNSAKRLLKEDEVVIAIALDLDGFKAINDTLGHAGGDALLEALSTRLRKFLSRLPGDNIAARVGGDEFVVLCRRLRSGLDAEGLVQDLSKQFKTPLDTPVGSLLVGASFGFALAERSKELEAVMLNADLALTEAKNTGRGSIKGFELSMRSQLERRLKIEQQLPAALKNAMIKPHYQFQVDMRSGTIVGLEALARWTHPSLGPVPPHEFIPIAEASGDIVELGHMILKAACRDVQILPKYVQVAVNLSIIQLLNENVFELVSKTLAESGLDARRLKLEVTESTIMHNVDRMVEVLSSLQAIGVTISLDDFGTGYSALSYINHFNWDELKIDKSFVEVCEGSPNNLKTIGVIISLAKQVGAKVMVEGLETGAQVEQFKKLGCRFAQGHYFSRPVPLEKLSEEYARLTDPVPKRRSKAAAARF